VPRDNAARMEGGWKEVTPPAWQTAIRHVEHGDYGDHQEWTPRYRLQLQLVPSQLAPRPTQALQLAQAVHSVSWVRSGFCAVHAAVPTAWSAGDQLKLGGGITVTPDASYQG